jgi:hypothetical protein
MEQINYFVPLLKKMYIKACVFDLNDEITVSDEEFMEASQTFFEKLDPNNHKCSEYKEGCVHCEFDKVMKAKNEFDEEYKDNDSNIVWEHFIDNHQDDEIHDFREAVLDLLLYLPLFSKKRFSKRHCVVLDSIQISLFNYLRNNVPSEFNKFLYIKEYD